MSRLGALLRALRRDRSGLALVEFAVIAPFLLLLYLGGFQISDAISCNRKVTITARAVADLTSQYAILSGSMADTILAASTEIMSPYDASQATLRVSEITTDASSNGTVTWSRAKNGTPLTTGASFTVPSTMAFPNVSYIYAEVSYNYTPMFSAFMPSKTLSQTIYMVPRVSSSISCDTCAS